jgi:glutamate dehydrogenase/leucine dehydrogenase
MEYDVKESTIQSFVNVLRSESTNRANATSSALGETRRSIDDMILSTVHESPSYAEHEAVFFEYNNEFDALFCVFIHSTVRGQAQGGTRFLKYESMNDLISDGLRLSQAMTMKNAVADIWWGGGKSIICPLNHREYSSEERTRLFQAFGLFVASLNGVYVAAEDMNTTPNDMLDILSKCRYVTCLPEVVGGSSNPSFWTAKGVLRAMQATLKACMSKDSLKDIKVGVQGVGNVGGQLAKLLAGEGAEVYIFDTNVNACCQLQAELPDIRIMNDFDDMLAAKLDIFSPCARGGILNSKTIPVLNSSFIIGAANNQLLEPDMDALRIRARGIVYLPDFFINRMGITNCANEQYGRVEVDLEDAVQNIYDDTEDLILSAMINSLTPLEVANNLAENKAKMPHPIWGHRGPKLMATIK